VVRIKALPETLRKKRRSARILLDKEVWRRVISTELRALRRRRSAVEGTAARRLTKTNERALARRLFLDPAYEYRPISTHSGEFQALKRAYPYYGYISVEVEDVPAFLMFSNNDDRVAQTYFWYGPNAFESLSLRLWRELARRSRHVFDVGAFTGVYTLTATRANREAEVYSFEPIGRVFGRLVVNLVVNRLGQRVRAFDVALGDADGQATMNLFQSYRTLSSGSSLVEKPGKEVVLTEHVETRRLDTLVAEEGIGGVDLVKVDVEQAEVMVVAGMEGVLREHRPHLLVEVVSQEKLGEILALLEPHGYGFAVVNDAAQKAFVNRTAAHKRVCNVLFSPMPPGELRAFCASVEPL
jgi:FkbM family methyltransferase